MHRRGFLVGSLALLVTEPSRAESSLPPELEALLGRFQRSPGFSARFVEEKRILLLKEPVTNRGRMYFQRPGTFARYVDEPFPSRLLLGDRRIRLEEGAQSRVIELDAQPAVRALVGGFLALLEGDRAALVRDYLVRFEARPNDGWQVVLVPRGEPLVRMLRELSFVGVGDTLQHMRFVEQSGDSSTTRFSEVQPGRTFSEAEQRELFTPKAGG